jgi:hypothetical protein
MRKRPWLFYGWVVLACSMGIIAISSGTRFSFDVILKAIDRTVRLGQSFGGLHGLDQRPCEWAPTAGVGLAGGLARAWICRATRLACPAPPGDAVYGSARAWHVMVLQGIVKRPATQP